MNVNCYYRKYLSLNRKYCCKYLTQRNKNPLIVKPSIIDLPPPPPLKKKRRCYGAIELDSERINRDASTIADEVLQHLTSLIGSKVKVTLEIEAKVREYQIT